MELTQTAQHTKLGKQIQQDITFLMTSFGEPVKEPSGLDRQDGKRPDGLTLIPRHSCSLVWDITVVS